MTNEQLREHLLTFSEEELFYRQYYEAKQSPNAFAAFIASVDPEEISRKHYVLPELKEELDVDFLSEEWCWDGKEQDIWIHKHPRFMPEWDFLHEFYEIMYVYQGEFSLFIGEDEIQMKKGYVCIIPPRIPHHISIFDDSICFNIKVRKSTFASSFAPLLSRNDLLSNFFLNTLYIGDYRDYILFRCSENAAIMELMSAIYMESLTQQKYYVRMMNSLLNMVFLHLMRTYEDTLETSA
ncbi:MAG: AraC family ligand binding domain-containing protein, partial [Clostridia bacterium]|nr:AraC family ligand binding domain-containing protein [Clostridia bacterium]